MKKKKQPKQREFVIFSEHGFFTGLAYGGEPQWSLNIDEAKPFNDLCKLSALQSIYHNELLVEFI